MNDITKLPRWARNEIERLRADLAGANRDIALIVGATPSAVEVDPLRVYRAGDLPRLYLPEDYGVRFTVAGGTIDVQLKAGELTICGQQTQGFADFIVIPQLSNVIAVRFEGTKQNA